eukprot:7382825-Prymnesium_polylepis.2
MLPPLHRWGTIDIHDGPIRPTGKSTSDKSWVARVNDFLSKIETAIITKLNKVLKSRFFSIPADLVAMACAT